MLVLERHYDREFVRRWVNWEEYLREERPDRPVTYEFFEPRSRITTRRSRRSSPSARAAIPAATIVEVAREIVAGRDPRSPRTSGATPRRATSGGWQVARCLQFLIVLMGAVGTPGGTAPGGVQQVHARAADDAGARRVWNELPDAARVPARVLRDDVPASRIS